MTKPTEIAPNNVNALPRAAGRARSPRPTGEEVPVRTFERGEEVVLVVLVNLDDERESDSVEAAKLEYTSRRGLIKLRGEAVFEDPSLIRFHPDGDAEILQRRDFVRVHTPHPVTVESETRGRRRVHTVDLSGCGPRLSDDETLAVDQTIRFTISVVTTKGSIEGIARVVRIREDGKRALMFEQIAEHDRQRLILVCVRTHAYGPGADPRRPGSEQPGPPASEDTTMAKDKSNAKGKAKGDKKGKKGKGAADGISVAGHPRAAAQVRRAKGFGGVTFFLITAYFSFKAQVPADQVALRALIAGIGEPTCWPGCAR